MGWGGGGTPLAAWNGVGWGGVWCWVVWRRVVCFCPTSVHSLLSSAQLLHIASAYSFCNASLQGEAAARSLDERSASCQEKEAGQLAVNGECQDCRGYIVPRSAPTGARIRSSTPSPLPWRMGLAKLPHCAPHHRSRTRQQQRIPHPRCQGAGEAPFYLALSRRRHQRRRRRSRRGGQLPSWRRGMGKITRRQRRQPSFFAGVGSYVYAGAK